MSNPTRGRGRAPLRNPEPDKPQVKLLKFKLTVLLDGATGAWSLFRSFYDSESDLDQYVNQSRHSWEVESGKPLDGWDALLLAASSAGVSPTLLETDPLIKGALSVAEEQPPRAYYMRLEVLINEA